MVKEVASGSLWSEGGTGDAARSHTWRLLPPRAGGASTEDLRVFTQQNISIDVAAFKKLPTEAVLVRRRRKAGPSVGGAYRGGVLGGVAIKAPSRVYLG